MNERAIRVLEYDKIIDMLKQETASEMTREVVSKLKPSTNIAEIRESLEETTEAARVIVLKGTCPLGAFYDIERSLHFARKGGTLTTRELLHILYNARVARECAAFLSKDLPELPVLDGIVDVLATFKRLEENISRCIISEDEISDNASPELRSIRREIVRQNEAIKTKMNQMIARSDARLILQDAIVTLRDGRYVIPVKAEHRSKVPGIVHDQSQSGATLFIEPQVIVDLNNQLKELALAEHAEIQRILLELSGNVAENFHGLKNNQKLLVKLDFIFSKGKLSSRMGGEEPQISEDNALILKEARHPLLNQKKVVPITVSLGTEYTTLVITGPNTGGKTVTLKTVGLLAMMTQSGLHIPASGGSVMPVFRKIYADIGDEQSIEQSLSTFSSHMNNIVEITEEAGDHSLVLLDELGGGTDPTEGAALAISVLDYLRQEGATIVATTHYNELKKYAITTPGVQNASMQFDVETLSPTYRLIVGAPGRSNAFEISEKLGLMGGIIDNARALIERDDMQFEEILGEIEKEKKAAQDDRDAANAIRIEMEKQKEEFEKQNEKLLKERDKIISDARAKAREIIRDTKVLSHEVADELKALSKVQSLGERNDRYDKARKKIRKAEAAHAEKVKVVDTNHEPVDPSILKVGQNIKLLTINQNGTIITLPDKDGNMMLQIGKMKINANSKDIMLIEENTQKAKVKSASRYGSMYRKKTSEAKISINVQGENLEDAVMDVEKYLDDSFIAGLETVTIIHGRGEGILRKGIHEMLKRNKHVASFRRGGYDEGGDGVTVVTLKK